MATTATTKDLDRLLEELKRTSSNYSSSNASRSPAPHSSRIYSNHQRSAFAEFSGAGNAGRQSMRSYSLAGSGGNRHVERWSDSSSSNLANYQRSQNYSKERGTGGLRRATTGDGGTAVYVRHATPAPDIPSGQQKRYQTTFRATLQHGSPASTNQFNQVNVTIDPEFGATAASVTSDNRYYFTPSLSRANQTTVTTPVDGNKGSMSYRELQLLEDLSSARQELAALKRASSVIDDPLPPATLPTQRRVFHHHLGNTEAFTNRHQTLYQSHHDVHHGSGLRRPQGRYDTMSSGYTFGMPERAMSSANVATGHAWSYRNGMTSGPQSPAPGYSSIRSMGSSLRSGGLLSNSQGYSARRERLRQEAEHAEARRQSVQNLAAAASSNDVRATSLRQQCRQHYHSMSTIQPERREFEEIETVTLQPIGRGVQDLMGSTATLNRSTRRPVASSMLEGLNRVDNSTGARQQRTKIQSFGLQSSAVDIPHMTPIRPQRATSNSYLSSLRRQSAEVTSETSSFQLQQQMSTDSSMHRNRQPLHQYHHQQASKPIVQPIVQPSHQSQQHSVLFKNQNQQQGTRNNVESTSQQITSNTMITNGLADLALVKATSTVWYRLNISRQEAISILKNQPPGSFLIRDSTTFKGAYGLAVKSPKPPNKTGPKSGFAKFMKNILNDFNSDLVRHYLIETVVVPSQGVRIKGFSAEQIFPDLLALVQYHTQYPVALPCCLVLPPVPPSQTGGIINASNSTLVQNGGDSGNGDSDSVTLVQNNGTPSFNPTPMSLNGHAGATEILTAPSPVRSVTSPLSPTAGMFHSELTSPSPTISCRCLYLGAVEVDSSRGQASLMQAVDVLIPGPTLRAVACDQMGEESPVQYTECQIQVTHNEGLLVTDVSRKLFFQRHYPASSFIYAAIDPRDKVFIHPNHTVLGLDKPKLFGFITKKASGGYLVQVFSEFDANCGAAIVTAQINSLLLPHK